MVIKSNECRIEPSLHGNPKRVILRRGILPHVPQVAVGTLTETDEVESHVHPTMYEVYFVLTGRALYTIGGETSEVGPGDLMIVPPNTPHRQQVLEGPHKIFYWGIETTPASAAAAPK